MKRLNFYGREAELKRLHEIWSTERAELIFVRGRRRIGKSELKRRHDEFWVSFCYNDGKDEGEILSQADHLQYLRGQSEEFLKQHFIGIDRGIIRPVQAGDQAFDYEDEQKQSMDLKRRNRCRELVLKNSLPRNNRTPASFEPHNPRHSYPAFCGRNSDNCTRFQPFGT